MQAVKVSPELQASSDRAYLYAYGIDEAYKHPYKTLVELDYPANCLKSFVTSPMSNTWRT